MKRALVVAIIILIGAVSFGCGKAAPLSDQDKAAIQKVHDDFQQAMNAAKPDIPALVKATYTEESKVLAPNFPAAVGAEAITKALSAGPPAKNFKFGPLEIDGRGDMAFVHGSYEGEWPTPSGELMQDKGKFVDVMKKQADGSWKLLYDTWNSDAPPPGLPVATGAIAANASPEVKNLAWFVGRWQFDVDAKASPLGPAGKLSLLMDCRWFASGQQVICTNAGTAPTGPYHEVFVMGADADMKAYKGYDLDNAGVGDIFAMTFKDNVWTMDYNLKMGGKPLKIRNTVLDVTPGAFSMKQEVSTGGAWTLAAEGKGRKIGG